jgi:hypothetical protein
MMPEGGLLDVSAARETPVKLRLKRIGKERNRYGT